MKEKEERKRCGIVNRREWSIRKRSSVASDIHGSWIADWIVLVQGVVGIGMGTSDRRKEK